MNITDELIGKFFRQECTAEERSAVGAYFDQHPQELDKYVGDEDWKTFDTPAKLHPVISKIMFDVIDEHMGKPKTKRKFSFGLIGVAASIIVLLGITVLIIMRKNQLTSPASLLTKTKFLQKPQNDTVYNKAGTAILIALKDGSTVLLSRKSEIVYRHLFSQKSRDIYLKGQALFKVSKDRTRPFTVYAGGLSTTALGTSFEITAFNNYSKVTVQLFTGKVVVKQQQNAGSKDTYLTPGHTLVMNKADYAISVISFNQNITSLDSVNETKGSTYIHVDVIKFQNQSLAEVIQTLQNAYHIKIEADRSKLINKTFTGEINIRTEKQGDVLLTIATLNKLTLSHKGVIYTLSQ